MLSNNDILKKYFVFFLMFWLKDFICYNSFIFLNPLSPQSVLGLYLSALPRQILQSPCPSNCIAATKCQFLFLSRGPDCLQKSREDSPKNSSYSVEMKCHSSMAHLISLMIFRKALDPF